MKVREVVGRWSCGQSNMLPALPPPVDYVVLAFPRGGGPVEIAREPEQWMAQAVAFEERRQGTHIEIEERPRRVREAA
jgi:hypothetical protein